MSGAVDEKEEENRKRIIMPLSSAFPVSLEWSLLIGQWHGGGEVCSRTLPPGKGQLQMGGSCY